MAFTKENAAIYSKQAHEARWSKKMPAEPKVNSMALHEELPADEFRNETLRHAREHIRSLQAKIGDALKSKFIDSKELREMATALKDLEGVEARLSNRPAPGNLRPVAQSKPKRSASYPEPVPQFQVMHEPTPVHITPETPQVVSGDWANTLF